MSQIYLDFLQAILTLILGPGGFILGYLSIRKKESLPKKTVEAVETKKSETAVVDNISARWEAYVDLMEKRLTERVERAEERAASAERHAQAAQTRAQELEGIITIQNDYIYGLRGQLLENDLKPLRWPPTLGPVKPTLGE